MISFRMKMIKVEQFAILSNNLSNDNIGFNTSISFGFNPSESEICVTTKYELMQEEEKLVMLDLSCFFDNLFSYIRAYKSLLCLSILF